MRTLVWSKPAKLDFDGIWDWIEKHDAVAAQQTALAMATAAERLARRPFIGRPGRVDGTREWPVSRVPYLLIYSVENTAVTVLRVLHQKQQWPPSSKRRHTTEK